MTAPTVYHAPAPVALCTTRPAQWWDYGNPDNAKAIQLCQVCPFRAACEPSADEKPVGVIRAGVAYPDPSSGDGHSRETGEKLLSRKAEVAELLKQGLSIAAMARQLGVGKKTVAAFLRLHMDGAKPSGVARSSQYRGVTWNRKAGRWEAMYWHGGHRTYVGSYTDEVEAARAYDNAVRELGKPMNLPDGAAA